MARLRFTINLSFLYRNIGTEDDETPEDLMSYKEFVKFIERADIYIVRDAFGEYLVFEEADSDD